MKLLVILATVALLVWLLRGDRRRAVRQAKAADASAPKVSGPESMVSCALCGLHLPATDALAGPDGRQFCCAEHRRGVS